MKRFFLSVLALFVCAAAPLSAQSKKGAAVPSTDDYNQSQFWIGNFPEGQYVVHLSRIVAVAQHKYILDNTCMVYEVTLITLGNTPTKFYYLETLGQNSGINAIRNVTDRAKELDFYPDNPDDSFLPDRNLSMVLLLWQWDFYIDPLMPGQPD